MATVLRCKKLQEKTGLSKAKVYSLLTPNPKRPKDYDPTFPKPIKLANGHAVGWIEEEVDTWIDAQVSKSRQA